MLEALITSKTRIKLMLKFFLNSSSTGYLRGLETEFGESSNAIRQELNRFEAAGLLSSASESNRKVFRANTRHPLFNDINSLLLKYVGIDRLIEKVLNHIGNLSEVYLVGDLAKGTDSDIMDLWIVGEKIDVNYLMELTSRAESLLKRKIRFLLYSVSEFARFVEQHPNEPKLLIWKQE